MAQITINGAAVRAVKNDDIRALLRRMIDDELKKSTDAVNTAFVDECVNALLELEQDEDKGFTVLIPLVSATEYLNRITGRRYWNALSRAARVAVVAAVFATSGFAVNAAVEGITGVNLMKEAGIYLQHTFEAWTGKEPDTGGAEETTAGLPIENLSPQKKEEPRRQTREESPAPEASESVILRAEKREEAPTRENIPSEQPAAENTKKPAVKKEEPKPPADMKEDEPAPQKTEDKEEKEAKPEKEHIVPPNIPDHIKPDAPTKEDPVFSHIEADLDGFKHDYIYGETLSYDGLTVYAVYSDGYQEVLPLSACTVTQSVDMQKTADYALRIMYQDSVLTVTITVRPDEETRGSSIESSGDWDYLLTSRGAYVTGYRGEETALSLNKLDGNKVVALCSSLFENGEITSLNAPYVTKIFPNAFKNAKQLQLCSTPRAQDIGESAFEGCEALMAPSFSSSATHIGEMAYARSGITDITLPEGMDTVPYKLCDDCSRLETVDLSGVSAVESSAFADCTALEEVLGTENLKAVGETAFYGDEKVTFETAPAELESVGTSGFAYCKALKFGELNNLKSIGDYAFMYCSGVTGVTLDNSITVIPQGAFRGTRIKEIALPEGLKRIEAAAFMSTMLRAVTIPESVEYIGARAFQTASGLTVTFEGSPEIENAAFFKSSRLKFYAYADSGAIAYAEENEISYEIIERS